MPAPADALFAAHYDDLHRLAVRQLRRVGAPPALGSTTLLHETYLAVARADPDFPDEARFMGYVARAMRRLIIDHARRRLSRKRGGGAADLSITRDVPHEPSAPADGDVDRLGDALDALRVCDPPLAELVTLRFFDGLTFGEIAGRRGVCERTVHRDWCRARQFLLRALAG